jgi:DNA ligase-1
MKKFANLIFALNGSTNPAVRQQELIWYFTHAEPDDAMWALFLLLGNHPNKQFGLNQLKTWVLEQSGLPEWLFAAAQEHTGDLTSTISRVLPSPATPSEKALSYWLEFLPPLRHLPDDEKKLKIQTAWSELDVRERFLFNKLLSGGFRTKFPSHPLVQSLATVCGTNYFLLAWRLAQDWNPAKLTFSALTEPDLHLEARLAPWPFPEFHEISPPGNDADPLNWMAVRDYPGLNVQLIFCDGQIFLWSENHEFLNPRFPAFEKLAAHFPENARILGKLTGLSNRHFYGIEHFGLLNREMQPMIRVYDILEISHRDCRRETYSRRRLELENLIHRIQQPDLLQPAKNIEFTNWEMLIKLISAGRQQGFTGARLFRQNLGADEYRLLNAPEFKILTVLLYVQRIPGSGLHKGLELTFAIQGETELVPCARIATQLDAADIVEILDFVKKNTVEKFGPVRSIKPELLFEIAFDAVLPSGRHKAGLKLEAPRVVNWRRDKRLEEIDMLQRLQEILTHEK